MTGRVEKPELVRLVSQRTNRDAETVSEIVDALLEETYHALKRGDSVSSDN
jgi:nucleoid DNA-binding protein